MNKPQACLDPALSRRCLDACRRTRAVNHEYVTYSVIWAESRL